MCHDATHLSFASKPFTLQDTTPLGLDLRENRSPFFVGIPCSSNRDWRSSMTPFPGIKQGGIHFAWDLEVR